MRRPERFKVGETLKKDIGPKLNVLVDFVLSLIPRGDSSTMLIKHTNTGCYFSTIRRGGGGGGGAAEEYAGPFAVSKKTDTTVSILGGNMIHGIDKIAVAAADLAVSASGLVYIELTYPGGTATTEFKTAAEMPTLETGKYQEELASITVEDSKITSVTQKWKNNDIKVIGRL